MKRQYRHSKDYIRKWWKKQAYKEALKGEHPYYFMSDDPNDWDKLEV